MTYVGIDFHGYTVTETGNVYAKRGKQMKPFQDKDGYLRIALTINGKQKKFHIHRLVYQLYVGKLIIGKICCHNDGNIKNNHYTNLRQDSQINNINDKLKHGTWQAGNTHPMIKYKDEYVEELQKFIKENKHIPLLRISKHLEVPYHLLFDIKRGKRKTRTQRINERNIK